MGKPINWPGMTNEALAKRMAHCLAVLRGAAIVTPDFFEVFEEAQTRIEETPDND